MVEQAAWGGHDRPWSMSSQPAAGCPGPPLSLGCCSTYAQCTHSARSPHPGHKEKTPTQCKGLLCADTGPHGPPHAHFLTHPTSPARPPAPDTALGASPHMLKECRVRKDGSLLATCCHWNKPSLAQHNLYCLHLGAFSSDFVCYTYLQAQLQFAIDDCQLGSSNVPPHYVLNEEPDQ